MGSGTVARCGNTHSMFAMLDGQRAWLHACLHMKEGDYHDLALLSFRI